MNHTRILQALCEERWAITPAALRRLATIVQLPRAVREENIRALEAELGRKLDNAHDAYIRDGVAVINVIGPMFRYADSFTKMSGATSYGDLAEDLHRAQHHDDVQAILLNVNSPGGAVTGCSELAERIFKARGGKPIIAYVDGDACSAAYWIASAADQIVANATAVVGSIGVVSSLLDTKKADEMNGIRELTVVSSNAPEKIHGYDGITDEAIDALRRTLNALESVFVGDVARNRSVSTRVVRADYGKGGVFVAGSAAGDYPSGKDAGLVDDIGNFESVLEKLIKRKPTGTTKALHEDTIRVQVPRSFGSAVDCKVVPYESHGKPIDGKWDAQKEERGVREWARKDKTKPPTPDNIDWERYSQAFLFVTEE